MSVSLNELPCPVTWRGEFTLKEYIISMLKNQLIRLVRYNCWANGKICNFIHEAGEEAADTTFISSFSTIRKTLYHIWDAELVWLKRLNQQDIEKWPPSGSFTGSLDQGIFELLQNSEAFARYIEQLEEASLMKSISYKNTSGKEFQNRVCDMITHCMNHSTYHRGQLVILLRQAGYTEVSSTDYITFCRL